MSRISFIVGGLCLFRGRLVLSAAVHVGVFPERARMRSESSRVESRQLEVPHRVPWFVALPFLSVSLSPSLGCSRPACALTARAVSASTSLPHTSAAP